MKYLLLTIFAFTKICYADTQVYQSVNKNGITVIGNKPATGAQIMDLPSLRVIPAYQMKNQTRFSGKELKRREILQDELSNEQQALKEAQDMQTQNSGIKTKDNTKTNERSRILQDAISEHQKNIAILNKQLGY